MLVLLSCGIEYEDVEVRIGPYRSVLDENAYFEMAYMIKENPDAENWEELKGEIKDFYFEWGYQYKVKVRKQERKPCVDEIDGYEFEYKVLEILTRSQMDVEDTFEVKLKRGTYNYVEYDDDNGSKKDGYYLPDGTLIVFDNEEIKTEFDTVYENEDIGEKLISGVFKYNFESTQLDQEIILLELNENQN